MSDDHLRSSEAAKKCSRFTRFHRGLLLLLPVGANARQPLPFSLIGGRSDVIQSQQQRVQLSVSHGARRRKHTYVKKKKKKCFSFADTPDAAISCALEFFFFFFFQTCWTTGCRLASPCWDTLLVWARGSESPMWPQWSTARRTGGATVTEVGMATQPRVLISPPADCEWEAARRHVGVPFLTLPLFFFFFFYYSH